MARVAVVDNDRDLLDLLGTLFEDWGWQILPHPSGRDAADFVRESLPDAVLLDLWLEHPQSGIAVCRSLADCPDTSDIPLVIFTGDHDNLQQHRDWLDSKSIAVIEKPFDIDRLHQVIEEAMAAKTG
ncbi:MAG: response regulator [Chloroflexota bacterium]